MFETADPQVFAWYIKNYGPEVNVFVDHSQIVQLEALRQGIWGTTLDASIFGSDKISSFLPRFVPLNFRYTRPPHTPGCSFRFLVQGGLLGEGVL